MIRYMSTLVHDRLNIKSLYLKLLKTNFALELVGFLSIIVRNMNFNNFYYILLRIYPYI